MNEEDYIKEIEGLKNELKDEKMYFWVMVFFYILQLII